MAILRRKFRARLRQISQALWYETRHVWLGQRWPILPQTVNLLANDICNSRCQMCLIWQQKRTHELTPAELSLVLADPLFKRLRYVGVSGGEPTLRADLPQIFQILAEKQPRLRGTGLITNAIRADMVIERAQAAAEICSNADLPFNIMVSLDGLGAVHDQIRGRAGNFESAWAVIQHFRTQTKIPVSFGCTITKDNLWQVDALLDFAQEQALYGRFRIADFINRLYNEGQSAYIRNFSSAEAYHLQLFFTRLIREFEPDPRIQRTYENIRSMLAGAPRGIACPYQTEAVLLDSRGQLSYCAPKSPALGSTLETTPGRLYRQNISIRQNILAHDCQNCIHDYHARTPNLANLRDQLAAGRWQRRLQVEKAPKTNLRPHRKITVNPRQALIVGWYGTETAGDKAILGELLHRLAEQQIDRITLASLNPFLSVQTLEELRFPQVKVIATYSASLLPAARQADLTIMGGGPLMDVRALGPVLHAFLATKQAGGQTQIAGCGIGPLHQPQYVQAVTRLLQHSDSIELRDSASVQWARERTQRLDIRQVDDLAVGYVQRYRASHPTPPQKQATLNCYLREWPEEYKGSLSLAAYQQKKQAFEENLAALIRDYCTRFDLRPQFLPMHHFVIGGDDRTFNRRFARTYLADLNPQVEIRPLPLDDLLASLQTSALNLTMRFHATLFACTLGVPFYAVDYTQGGKVRQFLQDRGLPQTMFSLDDIIQQRWSAALPEAL